jgi:group II intron reverse transcriptase/maturase
MLAAFWQRVMAMGGGFVLEVDIRRFFDSVDHGRLKELLRRRVRDGVLLRLISKWLHAGVLEDGVVTHPERGTPQGGVISPLLANVYLHEVIDVWWEREIRPRLRGQAHLFRYADDVVILFASEEDARRVQEVLPKRLAKAGLELHPDKTRLVDFRHPQSSEWKRQDSERDGPGTFALLGFTHYWARAQSGGWAVLRKTAKDRLSRTLRAITMWCRRFRHLSVREQWRQLCAKLRGHYGYFGILGNSRGVNRLLHFTERAWRRWLSRRSRAPMVWACFERLLQRYPLPKPTLVPVPARRSAKL